MAKQSWGGDKQHPATFISPFCRKTKQRPKNEKLNGKMEKCWNRLITLSKMFCLFLFTNVDYFQPQVIWALWDVAPLPQQKAARSSIILRKTFKFTAVGELAGPGGLHCTNVRDKRMGKHTWSSYTWHLPSAVVGLLTTLFLKSSDL